MELLSRYTCVWMICLLWMGWSGEAMSASPMRVGFLDERLRVPESSRFRMADYTESGVGLRFGVDKRLSFDAGNYQQAVARFSEAIGRYRYKAEIWVYLARSYFYMQSPAQARETILQAAAAMPDLRERFWDPLLSNMIAEVTRRAHTSQTEIDFYCRDTGKFLSLFRLYSFLEDLDQAGEVIQAAAAKGAMLRAMATMVSSDDQTRCQSEATRWLELAQQLSDELRSLGGVPPELPQDSTLWTQETSWPARVELLQLKVDYYPATAADYRELFDSYQELAAPQRAAGVLVSLTRALARLDLQADLAGTTTEEETLRQTRAELAKLRQRLQEELPPDIRAATREGEARGATP